MIEVGGRVVLVYPPSPVPPCGQEREVPPSRPAGPEHRAYPVFPGVDFPFFLHPLCAAGQSAGFVVPTPRSLAVSGSWVLPITGDRPHRVMVRCPRTQPAENSTAWKRAWQ